MSYRNSPVAGAGESWLTPFGTPFFIWDGDSRSFVKLDMEEISEQHEAWKRQRRVFAAAVEGLATPSGQGTWADGVEQRLLTGRKTVRFSSKNDTIFVERSDSTSLESCGTEERDEDDSASPDDSETQAGNCESSLGDRALDSDDDSKAGIQTDKDMSPSHDPLAGTGFSADELGYPLYTYAVPEAKEVTPTSELVDLLATESADLGTGSDGDLEGEYVIVDVSGLCLSTDGVEVGKHTEVLRRWSKVLKSGGHQSLGAVGAKGSTKLRLGNAPKVGYAKHRSQLQSIVCLVSSIETMARTS